MPSISLTTFAALSACILLRVTAIPAPPGGVGDFWDGLHLPDIIPHHEAEAAKIQEGPAEPLSIADLKKLPPPDEPPAGTMNRPASERRMAEYRHRYARALDNSRGHISPEDHLKAQQHMWLQTEGADKGGGQLPKIELSTLACLAEKRDRYLLLREKNKQKGSLSGFTETTANREHAAGRKNAQSSPATASEVRHPVALADLTHPQSRLPLPSGVRGDKAAPGALERYQDVLKSAAHISSRTSHTVELRDLHNAMSNVWRITSAMKGAVGERNGASLEQHADIHRKITASRAGQDQVAASLSHKRGRPSAEGSDNLVSLERLIKQGEPTEHIPLRAILDSKEHLPLPPHVDLFRAESGPIQRYQQRVRAAAAASRVSNESIQRQHLNQALSRIWRLVKKHPEQANSIQRKEEDTLEAHAQEQRRRALKNNTYKQVRRGPGSSGQGVDSSSHGGVGSSTG